MSTAHLSSRDPAPAIHSLIEPSVLAQIAHQEFGLLPSAPLRLIQRGLNDHYTLQTQDRTLVLRVYRHGWRSAEDVEWELGLVQHLQDGGAPVAATVPCTDGRPCTEVTAYEGTRQIAVFEHAPGRYTHFGAPSAYRVSPATCAEAFGRSMAMIHRAAASYRPASHRFSLDLGHLLDQPLAAIADIYTDLSQEVEQMRTDIHILRTCLEPHLATVPWAVCHGDMTGGNSTFWQGQVIHFDFDCAGPGWRVYDLGVFFWSLSLHGHGDDVWLPFVQGYRSHYDITDAELALVPAFAAIRVIWLMGLWCANAHQFGHHTLHTDYFLREQRRFSSFYLLAIKALAGVYINGLRYHPPAAT